MENSAHFEGFMPPFQGLILSGIFSQGVALGYRITPRWGVSFAGSLSSVRVILAI